MFKLSIDCKSYSSQCQGQQTLSHQPHRHQHHYDHLLEVQHNLMQLASTFTLLASTFSLGVLKLKYTDVMGYGMHNQESI